MKRTEESPARATALLNAYAFVAIGLALTGGFGYPLASVVIGPLLFVLPPVMLILGLRCVTPESDPSRDDQVMWLVGVTFLCTLLLSGASGTLVPTWSISLMDRLVTALGVSTVQWALLAAVRYAYDAGAFGRPQFLKPWQCRGCGYDLRGATSHLCPECGEGIHCRTCGKPFVAIHDDICRYCGTRLTVNPDDIDFDDDDD